MCAVGGEYALVTLAATDAAYAREHLEQIVEARGRVVLDASARITNWRLARALGASRPRWRWYSTRARSKYGM